tara:strand:- start:3800 stop:4438 length:639 start_codon:yes stop_codon:yes gene_type:complete
VTTPQAAADGYNQQFPERPPLAATDEWVTGTWCIGACYKNPNPLYGAYPHGYLERVHSMFPGACNILHVFSGGLTHVNASKAAGFFGADYVFPVVGTSMELVDMHGPEQGRHPTWQGDLHDMPEEWNGRFDLILADPPYSAEDAKQYDCPAPNRGKIMRTLRRVAQPGADLVWLDQVWPMHRKDMWQTWGHIGLVRSTNHRMRLVSIFRAVC